MCKRERECVCVCVWERERERASERASERDMSRHPETTNLKNVSNDRQLVVAHGISCLIATCTLQTFLCKFSKIFHNFSV